MKTEKMNTDEYTIKTFGKDGETELSPLMSREAVQNWVDSEIDGKVFNITRIDDDDAIESTHLFTGQCRFVEPLSYLTV